MIIWYFHSARWWLFTWQNRMPEEDCPLQNNVFPGIKFAMSVTCLFFVCRLLHSALVLGFTSQSMVCKQDMTGDIPYISGVFHMSHEKWLYPMRLMCWIVHSPLNQVVSSHITNRHWYLWWHVWLVPPNTTHLRPRGGNRSGQQLMNRRIKRWAKLNTDV